MSDGTPARVLLVDDHALFRRGLAVMLASAGTEVVGEAHNGERGLELAGTLAPDVVIMDLDMPGMGGIAAVRALVDADPHARVLVMTASDAEADLLAALAAGAVGYLLKDAGRDEVLRALEAVRAGDTALSPAGVTRLVAWVRRHASGVPEQQPDPGLTAREAQVLVHLARGESNEEMAETLYLSPSTIKGCVSAILGKLGAANRVQAAVWAARHGLV